MLSLALALPACSEERTAAEDGLGVRPPVPQAVSSGRSTPDGERCRGQLRGFLGGLDGLRAQLAAGLSYEDYLREVRRLEAVHAELPVNRLGIGCLTAAGAPGERALNRYLEAANTWGECLATLSCDTEEVEPKLQRRWALASDLLSAAQRGLR
jgi:hypothetical protein